MKALFTILTLILLMAGSLIAVEIEVGLAPWEMAFTSDGEYCYVSIEADNQVAVINTADQEVVETIDVGGQPRNICFTPDGEYAYLTCCSGFSNEVWRIDTETYEAEAVVMVGNNPTGIAISPNGEFLYVARYTAADVAVIRTADHVVLEYIEVGAWPFDVVYTPNQEEIWVVNFHGNTISIIDPENNQVVRTINGMHRALYMDFSTDGSLAYVTHPEDDSLSVISTDNYEVVTSIPDVGDYPLGIISDEGYIYVCNMLSHQLVRIDVEAYEIVDTIDFDDAYPWNIEINPVREEAYISCRVKDEDGNNLNGFIYVLDLVSPHGLPFADDFEDGLGGWTQYIQGNDVVITDDPVHGGLASADVYAEPAGDSRHGGLRHTFDAVDGIEITTWINMERYGRGDAPGSWGTGCPGYVLFGDLDVDNSRISITPNHEGRLRWLPQAGAYHDYYNFLSDVRLDLNTWYQYHIQYQNDYLRVRVRNEDGEVIIDGSAETEDFDINYVNLGAYCLSEAGHIYFDDFTISEWDDTKSGLIYDGNDRFVTFPYYEEMAIEDGDFSWVAYVKTDGEGNYEHFVIFANREDDVYHGSDYVHLRIIPETGVALFRYGGNREESVWGETDLQDDEWHQVAATRSGNVLSVYVDGELDGTEEFDDIQEVENEYGHRIGAYINPGGDPFRGAFQGSIDEVSVWSSALTEEDLQALMEACPEADAEGLVAYWTFDEGEGQVVHDMTENDLDGYLGISEDEDNHDPEWGDPHIFSVNDGGIEQIVTHFLLSSVYPNPFNSFTNISYSVAVPSNMSIRIYDLSGRLVETILDERQTAGKHLTYWNAAGVPSGLYIVQMEAAEFISTSKILLIK